jgi:hypothetical protein
MLRADDIFSMSVTEIKEATRKLKRAPIEEWKQAKRRRWNPRMRELGARQWAFGWCVEHLNHGEPTAQEWAEFWRHRV